MPSRNILKSFVPESYYHVYARGSNRQQIFADAADFAYFIGLFERYLSEEPAISKTGVVYPHFYGRVQLLAFCLMGNHFHLLIWQNDETAMPELMRSIMTSYSRYFNLKYNRSGAVFESRYKASRIDQNNYLEHISRYIHLNPRYWQRYPHSSLAYYFADSPTWLQPGKVEALFADKNEYVNFLKDYEEQKAVLEEMKYMLADR